MTAADVSTEALAYLDAVQGATGDHAGRLKTRAGTLFIRSGYLGEGLDTLREGVEHDEAGG